MWRFVFCGIFTASGCFLDAPAQPDAPKPVGPAPLRRLTNAEYANALADLFPNQAPVLPPLPADAIIGGFENTASSQQPSDVAISRYETIANLYAEGATRDDASVSALVGCDWSTPSLATSCATQFLQRVGRRIFRRPLEADELFRFQAKFAGWQSAVDFGAAVRLSLSAMLQSPQFVYRPEPVADSDDPNAVVPVEAYALASRLSFFLWASIPDDALLDAAGSGALATNDGVRAQAERLLQDPRARRTMWSFHRQWLGLDLVMTAEQSYRTPAIDPSWTPSTQASAEKETELFVENTLASGGTFRDLLLSPNAWVDAEMSRVYGLDPNSLGLVALSGGERAGVLTRVAFLAGTSHRGGTSPPIRGNAIELRLLCELPVQPPPNANLSMPTPSRRGEHATTRTLFEQRTAPAPCQGCHQALNGIGFGFEHYDAAGAWRAIDDGLQVDSSGALLGSDVDGPFDGAIELSQKLAASPQVYACATAMWLHFALGRAPVDAELPLVDAWSKSFVASGGDVRALLVSIVTSDAFRFRKAGY